MSAAFKWWLAIEVFGLAALPLVWRFFARLPGRGYAFSKAVGLLLIAYTLWIGATFRVLANDLGGILMALVLVAALSCWLGRDGIRLTSGADGSVRERPLFAWLRDHLGLVLCTEILTVLVLLGWSLFRAYNPEIAATEKPMEFAFINGVLNSRSFPPQDPWLSGYSISYYYFGYVMLGLLIRLTGVAPEVGFNLGVALWYSLTLVGVFGLCYELVGLGAGVKPVARGRPQDGRSLGFGVLGTVMVGVQGNLEGLIELAYNRGWAPTTWIRWLDIKGIMSLPPTGESTGGFWWWWRASRVIHDKDLLGNSQEVIDEFPFFSFLLGDLHPHVLALPFALLVLALALVLVLAARDQGWGKVLADSRHLPAEDPTRRDRSAKGHTAVLAGFRERLASGRRAISELLHWLGDLTGLGTPGVLVVGVMLGASGFLNTWDLPVYVGLATLALGIGLATREGLSWQVAARTLLGGALWGGLGVVAYLPFYLGFQSQAGGPAPNLLFPTRFSQYVVMFGPFLAAITFYLLMLSRRLTGETRRGRLVSVLGWVLASPIVLIFAIGLVYLGLPQGRSTLEGLLADPAVRASVGGGTVAEVLSLVARVRLANPWTYLIVGALAAWAISLLWSLVTQNHRLGDVPGGGPSLEQSSLRETEPVSRRGADAMAVLMIAAGFLLTFAVEFVYLRDVFGSRMNTVFKLYYQAWILMSIASVYALSRLTAPGVRGVIGVTATVLTALALVGSLYYPLAAIPSKAGNFLGQPTLDGLSFMEKSDPEDLAAIGWIRSHVPPTATVLEASGFSYSIEGAQRISMATGNPTLLGWQGHELQWRGKSYGALTAGRLEAVEQIYRSASPTQVPVLLQQWAVDYVYVGALERRTLGVTDSSMTARFGPTMRLVYDAGMVRIYQR